MNVDNRTLFIADNLDIMRMDSDTIDLIYLDPPFNQKLQSTYRLTSRGGRIQGHLDR